VSAASFPTLQRETRFAVFAVSRAERASSFISLVLPASPSPPSTPSQPAFPSAVTLSIPIRIAKPVSLLSGGQTPSLARTRRNREYTECTECTTSRPPALPCARRRLQRPGRDSPKLSYLVESRAKLHRHHRAIASRRGESRTGGQRQQNLLARICLFLLPPASAPCAISLVLCLFCCRLEYRGGASSLGRNCGTGRFALPLPNPRLDQNSSGTDTDNTATTVEPARRDLSIPRNYRRLPHTLFLHRQSLHFLQTTTATSHLCTTSAHLHSNQSLPEIPIFPAALL
jgi:hypothetical protein